MIATLLKAAALATALTFVGAVKPMSDTGTVRVANDATHAHLQCRMYFGCLPATKE
jgi:hypothetical protein